MAVAVMPASVEENEDLFDALGAGDLSDEKKADLLVKMILLVQRKTLDRIFDTLDETHQQRLAEVIDTEDPDLFEEFLRSAIPNYEQFFEEEALKLRREIIQKVTE
jgi:hypothetical protein